METQNNRVALDQHWAASASGDLEAEHQIYDDNVVCEYPQSGRRSVAATTSRLCVATIRENQAAS